MDHEIVWSDSALADLEAAWRVAAAVDVAVAEKLRVELLGTVATLRRFPFLGPAYERHDTGCVREIVCRRYRVFYRVDELATRVEILAVRHASRREPRWPK